MKSLPQPAAFLAALLFVSAPAYAATNIALWSMNYAGQANPAVLDSRQGPGQGVVTGNNASYGTTNDVLLCFNGLSDTFTTTNDVPPFGMFVNGAGAGPVAYNAGAIANFDGAVFYAQDVSGNEFSFTNSFSLELFFKTDGDWTTWTDPMYLLKQGEGTFRYGLILNAAGSGGALTFEFRTDTATNQVNLTAKNFMDGEWHYVLATYDATSGQAQVTVANQAGTTNWLASGAVTLRGAGNDGNLFIGRNVFPLNSESYTFFGFLDELQISSGVVGNSERIGRIPSIDGPAPAYIPPSVSVPPAAQNVVTGGLANFSVTAAGSPTLTYQWRRNGTNLTGQTASTLSLFPVVGTDAGNYDVVVQNLSNGIPISATSSVAPLTILAPYAIAEWPMDPAGGNFPAVLDARTAAGQGTLQGVNAGAGLTGEYLITFNDLGSAYFSSNSYPPIGMFVNGNGGAPVSYNAAALAAVNGGLFYPADQYGNEFLFRGPFSIELFFKTDGDQSGAGTMQLVMQGENSYRYGITVNESSAGGLRFAVENGSGTQTVDLTAANYADGNWHYLLAVYDSIANQLRLTVVKESGSETSATNTLPTNFGPLFASPAGNYNMFIGRNTFSYAADPRTFLGLIDEIQITAGAASAATRVGRIPSVDGAIPSSVAPFFMTQPGSVTTVDGSAARFVVKAQGSDPLSYQWRRNSTPVGGATNSALALFPAAVVDSGTYDVVVSNGAGSSNSVAVSLVVLPPVRVARWSMDATGGNFPCTLDVNTNAGDGFFTGNAAVGAAEDHLVIFNDSPPVHEYRTSNSVPPTAMFINGHSGGVASYDAGNIAAEPGALLYPTDQYGNEFSFGGAFSIEMFFKTTGDQSGAGNMELLKQGEGFFRYGLILNEATNGSVRFAVNNGSTIQVVDLGNATDGTNYADGAWHYLLAQYDTFAGVLRLIIVNEDGTDAMATTALPPGFGPLPAGNDGNLFIGRNTFSLADPRTFLGLIDEVQLTDGLVPRAGRLGRAPSLDITITKISVAGGTVTIDFTGGSTDTPASFVLQGAAAVNGAFGDLSASLSTLGVGSFRATIPVAGAANFYRIRRF